MNKDVSVVMTYFSLTKHLSCHLSPVVILTQCECDRAFILKCSTTG